MVKSTFEKSYAIERSNEEIDEALGICIDAEAEGTSQYPGMTYEDGVKAALEWVIGETDEPPFDEMG